MTTEIRRSVGLSATIREYTSISHVRTAALMCRQTWASQQTWHGTGGPAFDESGWQAIVGNAVGAVFASAAFVEAGVNELLKDCAEGNFEEPSRKVLSPQAREGIGVLWSRIEREPTRTKWRKILAVVGRKPDVTLDGEWHFLSTLRNALVHAKPEDVTVVSDIPEKPVTSHSLAEGCKRRFAKNPKVHGATGFLEEFLAHPCAEWSFRTALAYSQSNWEALGAPVPYDHVLHELQTR